MSSALAFPLWLRLTHVLNVLFLTLLLRSGLEILSAHPKLYWNDDCDLGSEWLSFNRTPYPKDQLFTADDQETSFPSWLALPGHQHWDLGRHWHFLAVNGWIATGLAYVGALFATGTWDRLLPTSWSVFPGAWRVLWGYLHGHVALQHGAHNPLQQLTYAGVVVLLAPLSIATGAAMSPAVAGRFPTFLKLFHGRQGARSLHFLCLGCYVLFLLGHVSMVALHGLSAELALITFGRAVAPGLALALAAGHFKEYALEVGGLVERPLRLTLDALRALPRQEQITKHICIQGWSGVAEWAGLPFRDLIRLCRPLPEARYAVLWAYDEKSRSEPRAKAAGRYYGTLPLAMAMQPQTLLAYDLNGGPLPLEHGAPLRLRLENQYGFTMVKYIRAIEFVETYRTIGKGKGGWPEEHLHRSREASI